MEIHTRKQTDMDYFQAGTQTLKTKDVRMEEAILTVLDAELAVWRRYAGRLGSVQTIYKSMSVRGIGTEWREPDPYHLEMFSDSEQGLVMSKNAEALLQIYNKASDSFDQTRFAALLLSQLSGRTKYATVGYLILLVLFRIGRLPQALECALSGLRQDKAYAFSDFLRLLDGLLRFEHCAFNDDWITAVNLFVAEIDTFSFRIWHRVVALKCARLVNA